MGGRPQRLPPRCIRKTCYVIRSQFIEFLGPDDQSTTRPQDQRTTGPEDQRTREPQNQRTIGPEDQRSREPQNQRTIGPEDQRSRGPQDQRTTGPEDHRTRGPKDQTTRGPQGQRSLNFFSRGCKYFSSEREFFPGNVNCFSSIIPYIYMCAKAVRLEVATVFQHRNISKLCCVECSLTAF